MGKRKKSSRGPTGPKKREPLATAFRCVFCNHETSVSVKMDKKSGVGNLSCKSCGQNFQTSIHNLAQPVDVYADWIDACEAVANDRTTASTTTIGAPRRAPTGAAPRAPRRVQENLAPGEKYTDDDDGFVEDDEVDAEAEFAE